MRSMISRTSSFSKSIAPIPSRNCCLRRWSTPSSARTPIRVWREHRDLSQRQLAELAGISTPYLSQLEAGKREASQRVIRRLAKALRVDVDDLIRVEPEAVSGNRARLTEGADGGGAESAARLTRRRGARR